MFSYIFMKILESRPHRYDWGIDFLTKGQAGKIKELIVTNFVRSGMAVLDVGCGTGDLAVRAARAGAMVTGVDISQGMLAVAQQRVKKNGLGNRVVLHQAGFEITEKRYSFLESIVTVVAKKSEATQPAAAARAMQPDQDRSPIKSLFDFCGRWFPNPVVPGLRKIGTPGRDSPVVVTGNFHLTVRRVEKTLANRNCYLLVAQSKGINVWCASAGGEMNTHSVVTALKTSDIASRVDHRVLILPQLSAPGIDTKLLQKVRGTIFYLLRAAGLKR